ncbi:MAG: GAF domain-containing protein, partial [Anaerolineae bacterium]
LRTISEAVDLRQELDALLDLIYRQTVRIMEVDNFYVALYDEMRREFRMAFYIKEGEERVPSNLTWPLGTGLTSQIVQTGEPIVTNDYLAECERRGAPASGKPARAWLGVPLVTGPEGDVLGVLNVSSFRPETVYSPEQVALMRTLADQAAVAIDRMNLYQSMQDRATELATLNEVSRAVSSSLDLEGIPVLIMKKVVDLLAVEAGSLLLVDQEVGDLVFKVALRGGEYEFLLGRRHPMGQGIVGCVAETGESQIVNDAQSDPRWDNKVDQDTGFVTETILCVPMISRDKVIGVIEVINHCDGRPFTDTEAWLLEAFAAQAAIAIENAQLYTKTDQALAQRVEELSTMQRIDRELNATLDFDLIMDMTLEWALRGTGAPAGIIAFHDEEQQGLLLLASQGYPPEFERYRHEPWPLGESAVGIVVQSGKPVLVADLGQEPEGQPIQSDSRSQLLAPILREDRVIGAVILESPQPKAFNQDGLALVQRLADHAAIAIENARLYQDIKLANQAKSEFIDFVAHELKQPMTAMQGYAKMLTMGIGGELTDTQNQFVEVITSNVDRMGKLVNDLLEISRLEAGLGQNPYGFARKLTLISAPAGFGKTTLLSEWIAHCGPSISWLSLD